jgi:phage gp36-like protein
MASTAAITLHALVQETASGSGAAVDLGQRTSADLSLLVSAGTGTTDVSIETSDNGVDGWQTIGSFPTCDGPGGCKVTVPGCSRYIRAAWILADVCTFSVAGVAVLVYCTPADVRDALHANALAQTLDIEVDRIARKQTDVANSYLKQNPNVVLPLLSWGDDLRTYVADLVAYQLMKQRGFNPESSDQIVIDAKNDAIAWFKMVAAGKVTPDAIVDSTQTEPSPPGAETADAYSEPLRGW